MSDRNPLQFLDVRYLQPIAQRFGYQARYLGVCLPHLREYLPIGGISFNRERLCHFLAQIAHESAGFDYLQEIADGSQYEGRTDLGNVRSGDGARYKGRGLVQLTGRYNYRRFGRFLGVDLEGNPSLAESPAIAVKVAVLFWVSGDLNWWSDRGNLREITKIINGGLNGYESRLEWLRAFMNSYDKM